MKHDDAVWLAGVLDARGSVFAESGGDQVRLVLHTSDTELLARVQAVAGGRLLGPYVRKGRPSRGYLLAFRGPEVATVVRAVAPWVGPRLLARFRELGLGASPRVIAQPV